MSALAPRARHVQRRTRARARSAAETCLAANRGISLRVALPRAAARLKSGDPFRIVAVGSSTTRGLGVLSGSATYPEVMRRELMALQPGARVEVINSGRIGERIPGTVARLQQDVLAHRPDLVVWQLGTKIGPGWNGASSDVASRHEVVY